mgnify:FL=1|tara:strand:- start:19389 stop:20642 length:1254 start_codon:yes stop_codon:yes gene_type:complete
MAHIFRLWRAGMLAALTCGAAAAQGAPEIVPPGWSMRTSTSSVYLTRPDMPNIQIAIVNDVRPELPAEEKFEAAKAFFAKRAQCPALATAETRGSFAGLYATDDPDSPTCRLIGMGHWVEDGLQMAVIVNTQPEMGPNAGSYSDRAMTKQIIELFMLRHMISKSDETPTPTAEGYADSIPYDHRPVRMINMIQSRRTASAWAPVASQTVLLFPKDDHGAQSWASRCLDWDPAMFAPGDTLPYDTSGQCQPFLWRWKDGRKNGEVEARSADQQEWKPLAAFEANVHQFDDDSRMDMAGTYRRFTKGAPLDVAFGADDDILQKVASGALPASALGPYDIILLPDGRFIAGTIRSATLPGGKAEGGVKGSYYFNGHAATLLLEGGHAVEGFAGWLDKGPEGVAISNASSLNINGWTYYSR